VNSVHPSGVDTPMVTNDVMLEFLGSTPEIGDALSDLMPVNLVESSYISNAIA
jgi:hypothetical protein